jgi:uncharacterized MnhB-related membrane protein
LVGNLQRSRYHAVCRSTFDTVYFISWWEIYIAPDITLSAAPHSKHGGIFYFLVGNLQRSRYHAVCRSTFDTVYFISWWEIYNAPDITLSAAPRSIPVRGTVQETCNLRTRDRNHNPLSPAPIRYPSTWVSPNMFRHNSV